MFQILDPIESLNIDLYPREIIPDEPDLGDLLDEVLAEPDEIDL